MNRERAAAPNGTSAGENGARRLERLAPWLLAALIVVAYLPSLGGGFLNWDDPWLIEKNPILARGNFGSLRSIWSDFSFPARFSLGAEYLPVRDTVLWLEVRAFGVHPIPLRCAELAAYVGAALLMRAALVRTLENRLAAEAAAWVFALHPVHVESVAWLSGEKDVLALLFVGAALLAAARESRSRVWAVPALLLLAHFSKSMTVVAGGLVAAQDFVARRRFDSKMYGLVVAVAAIAVAADLHVGSTVGMTEAPAGGSRVSALVTMGPVWLRYLWLLVWPGALSLVHDVPTRTAWSAASLLGYAAIVGSFLVALWFLVRRRCRVPLAAWIWLWLPLAPVSQIVFPLQNRMADRYLFLSVMAVSLAVSMLVEATRTLGLSVAALAVVGGTAATAWRSTLFSSSAAIFGDATLKTHLSAVAPYQLGQALEDAGDPDGARAAYEEALGRNAGAVEAARRATNDLARIYARNGRLDDAERVLERGRKLWPDDPKILGNLRKVLAREHRRTDP